MRGQLTCLKGKIVSCEGAKGLARVTVKDVTMRLVLVYCTRGMNTSKTEAKVTVLWECQ